MSAALVAAAVCAVAPAAAVARPLHVPARAQDGAILAQSGSRYVKRFWSGVDLGATVPGTLPGELATTRADYDRWLRGMGALGANVVRVYTLMKPRFYEALAAYNARHRRSPIRLIQGVWIDEERFLAAQDAYAITASFDRDLAGAVRALHGDATLPPRRGYASGRYRADVSRWLWPGRSASSGTRRRRRPRTTSTPGPRPTKGATSRQRRTPRRWRAGLRRGWTTWRRSRRDVAGAGR